MIALWFVLAAAAGYAAGHYRLLIRALEALLDAAEAGRWYSEPIAALMLLIVFLLRPRRTLRNIRRRDTPDQRQQAPEIDPRWGTP